MELKIEINNKAPRDKVLVISPDGDLLGVIKLVSGCEDCGRLYGDIHGFPDLIVPNDIWELLMPGRNGGGLLCPSCMCKRASDLGIHCQAIFRSGPFGHVTLNQIKLDLGSRYV